MFRNSTAGLRHLVLTPAWHVSCVTLGHSLAVSVQVSSSAQKKPARCRACEAASGVQAALGPRPHRASCVAEPKTSPTVFPLGLRSADSAKYVVIACLVQGFFPPGPVQVTWSPSNENATISNFPPVKAESGALYTMSSQLTLPANQCPDNSVLKCQVQHSSNTLPPVSVPCKGQRAGWGGRWDHHLLSLTGHLRPSPGALHWDEGGLPRWGPQEGAAGGEGRRAEGPTDLLQSLSQFQIHVQLFPLVSVPRATSPAWHYASPPSRICFWAPTPASRAH